jgi:hypothetical protein
MQGIIREKLLTQAMKLSEVSNLYYKDATRFVEAYIIWLIEAEKDLSTIRSPLSVILQAEKTLILAVMDGYIPEYIQAGKSIRKNQRAAAAKSIEKISKELYSKIENIDQVLQELNEKLCHAVAVVCSNHPGLMIDIQNRKVSADNIWQILGSTAETMPMYNYFSAKLSAIDREYLLLSIIQNIISSINENEFRQPV